MGQSGLVTLVMVLALGGCGSGDEDGSSEQCDGYSNGICIQSVERNCGDGRAFRGPDGEGCDDGNQIAGDGCSDTCKMEEGWVCSHDEAGEPDTCHGRCGDGLIVEDEVCDTQSDRYCFSCKEVTGSCGDGVIQEIEGCDPGDGDVEHCVDCQADFGWICTGAPSVCEQSGLPDDLLIDELTDEEVKAFCEWQVAIAGGPGETHVCAGDRYQTNTVEQCVQQHSTGGSHGACTVGNIEEWAASWNVPCDLNTGRPPECLWD